MFGVGPRDAPIVVGGCHRSGTSLVRRILDSHPRIYCGPEVKFFRDFYGDYAKDPVRHARFMESARAMLPESELFELLGEAFVRMHERAARSAGKPRWADKAPENVVFLEQWSRLLGDGWVLVHVVRNPLDTLSSIKEWEFPLAIPASLEERVELYLRYAEAGLAFAEAHPERCARVVYEDLVADPARAVEALMERLGEQLDPRQLEVNRAPHQPGLEDPKVAATTEVHRESVGRWRDVLTAEEAALIVRRTAPVWSRVDRASRWPLPSLESR